MSEFNQINSGENFDEYYAKFIRPKKDEYEAKRIIARASVFKRLAVVAVSFLIVTAFSFIAYPNFIDLFIKTIESSKRPGDLLTIILLVIGVLTYFITAPYITFGREIKSDLLPIILKYFGDNFNFFDDIEEKIITNQIDEFEIFSSYNRSHYEDLIVGRFRETGLQIFEARLSRKEGKRTYTVFNGLIVIAQMNKNFKGKTIVKQDRFFKMSRYERVKLEDPTFEKYFDVSSTDQIEARYLLTTSFMERLLDLAGMFEKQVECSFFDNKLMIAIKSTQNRFEPVSGFKEINFYDNSQKIVSQIATILEIIEILKLDEKTRI